MIRSSESNQCTKCALHKYDVGMYYNWLHDNAKWNGNSDNVWILLVLQRHGIINQTSANDTNGLMMLLLMLLLVVLFLCAELVNSVGWWGNACKPEGSHICQTRTDTNKHIIHMRSGMFFPLWWACYVVKRRATLLRISIKFNFSISFAIFMIVCKIIQIVAAIESIIRIVCTNSSCVVQLLRTTSMRIWTDGWRMQKKTPCERWGKLHAGNIRMLRQMPSAYAVEKAAYICAKFRSRSQFAWEPLRSTAAHHQPLDEWKIGRSRCVLLPSYVRCVYAW